MDIKDSGFYSIKEVTKIVGYSSRKLQRIAKKNNYRKIDNRYLFTGLQIKKILNSAQHIATTSRQTTDKPLSDATKKDNQIDLQIQSLQLENERLLKENEALKSELKKDIPHQEKLKKAIQLITLEAMEKGVMHKIFTDEEYNEIIGTMAEVDFQKEQVNYLRGRVEKQDTILDKLVKQVSERNWIEAKSLDKGFDN
jgi:hypothetical protein